MVVFLVSPVPLDSSPQRPHNLAEEFSKVGHKVIWIDPPINAFRAFNSILKGNACSVLGELKLNSKNLSGARQVSRLPFGKWLYLFLISNLPFRSARTRQLATKLIGVNSESKVICMVPSKMAIFLIKAEFGESHFDLLDDYEEFSSAESTVVRARLETAISNADCISVSSSTLGEKVNKYGRNFQLVRNACHDSTADVRKSRNHGIEIRAIYVGTVAEWFDWEWMDNLAISNPGMEIDIFGPVYVDKPKQSKLNLRGPIARTSFYKDSVGYTHGLIPFKINRLTESVDPVKLYEYLGLGLKVVSSPLPEVEEVVQQNGWEKWVTITPDPGKLSSFSPCTSINVPTWGERYGAMQSMRRC